MQRSYPWGESNFSGSFESGKTPLNPWESQRSLFAQTAYQAAETVKETKIL